MIMRKHATVLLGAAVLAGPAFAQTAGSSGAMQPSGAMQGSGATTPAMTSSQSPAAGRDMTSTAPGAQGQIRYITENRRDLWRASRLEGVDVYNERNEKIGDISEVLVDRQGRVEAVVIGVGGFLGLGQRDVAVPFAALTWQVGERQNTAATTPSPARPDATSTTASTRPSGQSASPAPGTATSPSVTAPSTRDETRGATRYDQNRDYPARAVLAGATKDQLMKAPEFQFAK